MTNNTMASDSRNVAQGNVMALVASLFKPVFKETIKECLNEKESEEATENDDGLLTVKEVCDRLGVDRSTLWRWNKERYLCAVKLGRKTVYKVADVQRIIK